jgi:hypothetical protein
MQIDERVLQEVVGGPAPDPGQVGWFAARQPGLFRFLDERLGEGSDAFGVAVDAAWRIAKAFEGNGGARRIGYPVLERAESALVDEASLRVVHGSASRQPIVLEWVASYFGDPPLPLGKTDAQTASTSVAAFVYALDQAATGWPLP